MQNALLSIMALSADAQLVTSAIHILNVVAFKAVAPILNALRTRPASTVDVIPHVDVDLSLFVMSRIMKLIVNAQLDTAVIHIKSVVHHLTHAIQIPAASMLFVSLTVEIQYAIARKG